ncbi:arylsulfatase [Caulifigura coniformis]|nr:arylsulfatase [Caulifigura coniformis]
MPQRLALFFAVQCAAFFGAGDVRADRPNVIVVMTDDQGYGDFSCHGNPVLKTPHLDRLHGESIRLTDFHVAPMCTPTRGQLMTGVDCLRNGAMNVSSGRTMLRLKFPTAGDLFTQAGYRTGQFGKWHLGDTYPYRPQDRGFQETVFFPSSHVGSAPDFFSNDYFDDVYSHNGVREKYEGYCTDVFFREAMQWMKRSAEAGAPFFCYLATNAPHGPWYARAEDRQPYADQKEMVAGFFGMLANIDDNMGRLETFLTESGLKQNTLLVFLTDNGGGAGLSVFNAGMRGGKVQLYEGGHRVPCFIRWPDGALRPPGDLASLCEVQDLLPTLLDLCDVSTTTKFDGLSLASQLRGSDTPLPDRTLVIQYSRMDIPAPRFGDACVLHGPWRLVSDRELYDLRSDPRQSRNVLSQHPDVVDRLRTAYRKWWDGIEPGLNQREALIIGSEAENPVLLSPADWEDSFLDQGKQVREGLRRNGGWNVEAAQAGEYRFTLRRWPAEAPGPITAGKPEEKNTAGVFPAGVALPVASARIVVGDQSDEKKVAAEDEAVEFTLTLPAGRTQLRTMLLDAAGQEIAGAYYVNVHRR